MQASILSRMIILGLCLGALAVTGEPTDTYDSSVTPGRDLDRPDLWASDELVPEAGHRLELLEELPEMELTEERAKAMAMLDQASQDLIDVDKMVKDQKKEAKRMIKYWKKKIRKSSKELRKAKKKKRSGLKKLNQLARKKKCKGKGVKNLSWDTWNNNKHCQEIRDCKFAKRRGELLEEEELLQEETRSKTKGQQSMHGRRRRKKGKKAKKKEKKQEKCAKSARKARSCAKKKCKKKVLKEYKRVRSAVSDYKKQLRKAKFQLKVLPRIVKMLKPSLLKALSQVDMGNGAEGALRTCKADGEEDCVPVDEIDLAPLLINFMKVNLHATLWPHLYKVFDIIQRKIWTIVDPIAKAAKTAIVTAVGSIPFVGGFLAAGVALVFDALLLCIKMAVGSAFTTIRTALQMTIVSGIIKAVTPVIEDMFNTGNKKLLASQMEQTANDAEAKEGREGMDTIKKPAKGAEKQAKKEAKEAEKQVEADGEGVRKEQEAADAEDADEDKKDEADDDDDE